MFERFLYFLYYFQLYLLANILQFPWYLTRLFAHSMAEVDFHLVIFSFSASFMLAMFEFNVFHSARTGNILIELRRYRNLRWSFFWKFGNSETGSNPLAWAMGRWRKKRPKLKKSCTLTPWYEWVMIYWLILNCLHVKMNSSNPICRKKWSKKPWNLWWRPVRSFLRIMR